MHEGRGPGGATDDTDGGGVVIEVDGTGVGHDGGVMGD